MINLDFIVSCVPKNKLLIKNNKIIKKKNILKIINYTGFDSVNRLPKNYSSKKFLFNAINKFISFSNTKINSIDAIIYSSHSRQNEMPIFSGEIQKKFNFSNDIFCYDLPNSCTGFTNGLIHSYSLIKSKIAKKVLLICADTHSKIVDNKNENLLPVIGDGCACILISENKKNFFKYDHGVDGSDALNISIEKNNKKLNMNGMKVFEFALKRVAQSIKKVEKKSKIKLNKIDYFSLHQPNKTIHNHLISSLKIKKNKVISSFKFGNTSSASIPISICSNFQNRKINKKVFLFSGFGSGFLWSSIIMKINKCFASKVFYL